MKRRSPRHVDNIRLKITIDEKTKNRFIRAWKVHRNPYVEYGSLLPAMRRYAASGEGARLNLLGTLDREISKSSAPELLMLKTFAEDLVFDRFDSTRAREEAISANTDPDNWLLSIHEHEWEGLPDIRKMRILMRFVFSSIGLNPYFSCPPSRGEGIHPYNMSTLVSGLTYSILDMANWYNLGWVRSRPNLFTRPSSGKALVKMARELQGMWWTNRLNEELFYYLYDKLPVQEEERFMWVKNCPVSTVHWDASRGCVHTRSDWNNPIECTQTEDGLFWVKEEGQSWGTVDLGQSRKTWEFHCNTPQFFTQLSVLEGDAFKNGRVVWGFRDNGHFTENSAPARVQCKVYRGMVLARTINGESPNFHHNTFQVEEI